MAEYGYTTVAEEYRGSRTRLYSVGKGRGSTDTKKIERGELLQWGRLLVCAAVFLALVVTKVNMPERFAVLRTFVSAQTAQSVDYRQVFSAVGQAIGGEQSVRQTVNDVYMEVFHPNRNENQAVETAAVLPVTELSQQEPINALLAFSQYWDNCGAWLYEEGTREAYIAATPVETPGVAESAPPDEVAEENPAPAPESVPYDAETLPAGVCMEQRVLDLDYATPVSGWLSSPFGYREHPIEGAEKFHRGLDIAAPEGTAICAFADGAVRATGESSSLGKYIMVSHDNGLTTIYAHCSKITAGGGTKVKRGDKIAEVGNTGLATGAHLHFAMQQGETYLNPIYYVSLEEAP